MRIFYDHQVTSLQDAGGISRYFYEIVLAMLRAGGIEPELLLGLEHSVIPFRTLPGPARVFSIAGSLKPGYQRYAINEALTALTVPLRGGFDVYHATYQRWLPYVRSRTLVVTHHDSTPEHFPHLFPDAASIHARLEKLYTRADRILCISESSRRDLLRFHAVDAAKTEVIHHGFTPLVDSGENAPSFDGRPFLLYVGSRAAYKNFPLVLAALARQKDDDLFLLVMGGGPFSGEEDRLVESLHLEKRIRIVPRATDGQLAAAYRAATLFVYPTLYEGFGFPPLEAMYAGCPALVSHNAALREICDGAAFYFVPESIDELAGLIEALLSDERLRHSNREAGFAQVRRYTWEKAGAATFAAYGKAIAEKS